MSTEVEQVFGSTLKELLREVVREELQALNTGDKLMTAEQAAEDLALKGGADAVRRLAREGHLTTVNLGENTRRFKRSEVQKLVQHGIQ